MAEYSQEADKETCAIPHGRMDMGRAFDDSFKTVEPDMLVIASPSNSHRPETDPGFGVHGENGDGHSSQINGQPNGDSEGNDVDPEIDDLFSMRRPRDALAGFGSGLKNIGKGVVMGVGAAVVCPIHGAKTGGVKGAVTGLGSGLLALGALPVCGITTGVIQMGRGIVNTPAAINEGFKGEKTWDKKNRVWFRYNLKDEAKLVLEESEEDFIKRMSKENKGNLSNGNGANFHKAESQRQQKPSRKVKELEYYELLGVEANATPGQIKKAYYLQARKLHPDKNPDDPSANEKFQSVGAAYQVLSDPGLREKYDKLGKEGVDDAPLMDSAAFYMMIFGSEKFDAYVGQLKFATMMLLGEEMEGDGSEEFVESIISSSTNLHLKYIQGKREVSCAQELAKFLDMYVEEIDSSDNATTYEQFKKHIEAEAKELTAQAVGGSLLSVIGYVYVEQAKRQLGFKHSVGAGIGLVELRRKGHTIANNFRLVKSSIHGMRHASKELETGNKKQASKEMEAENKENQQEVNNNKEEREMESFLVMVDAIWNYSVLDVESTLRHACQKVLFDNSVSVEARAKRAEGLYIMGKIFKEKGSSAKEGLNAFKDQFRAQINAQNPQQQTESESAADEDSSVQKEAS